MSTPLELLTNGLQVTSTANYTNSVTSITVNTPITGPSIPALSAGQTMRCYWDGELIGVTAISGTGNVNWTISRAIEGTIPVSHVTGSTIYQILSQGGLQQSIKDTVQGASCGPYASLPSSANTGAQYICTDSPYDLVWTGSAWSPFAYNAAATIPLDSNFTWINQDSATTSSSYGPIVFTRAGGGTDCVRARVRTIPYSTPRRLTCCFVPATIQANTNSVGIFIADSGTTPKMHFFCYSVNSSSALRAYRWTNPTTYSGTNDVTVPLVTSGPIWLRIRDDGTNNVFSWSPDGLNFIQVLSTSRTAFLTSPAQWGFGLDSYSATVPIGMTVVSWVEENI